MPLQKSFSDQNHSASKSRPSWRRNKSFPGQVHKDEGRPHKATTKQVPVPVSSITKNKLNVFQFDQPKTTSLPVASLLAANDSESIDTKSIPRGVEDTSSMSKTMRTDGVVQTQGVKEVQIPATPAARLALPDLIGMIDVHTVPMHISPDERIMWDHDTTDITSSASSYGTSKRKCRARSSSPVASPAHKSVRTASGPDIFDLRRIGQSIKTPQPEPNSEIWARYGAVKSLQRSATNTTFASVLYSSSPQASKAITTSRSDSRLRRSITCGNQWPKRRRLAGPEEPTVEEVVLGTGPSKLSLVSALLEKVNENYVTSQEKRSRALPRRSTPPQSPGVGLVDFMEFGESPTRSTTQSVVRQTEMQDSRLLDHTPIQFQDQEKNDDLASSDYGEFDDEEMEASVVIDCDTIPSLEQQQRDQRTWLHSGVNLSKDKSVEIADTRDERAGYNGSDNTTAINDTEKDDDEFGDMDDDDLVNMVAEFDPKAPTVDAYKNQQTGPKDRENTFTPVCNSGQMESEDEFGDELDDEDFQIAEAVATQSAQVTLGSMPTVRKPVRKARAIQRYLVTDIVDCEYINVKGRLCLEKMLLVTTDDKKENTKSVHLRDGWINTTVTEKAYVHIIGNFENDRIVIDDARHMLILHPDHLISSTVVADSFSCIRRAVLQDRVKATSDASQPLVYGTILHEIFQAAMLANRWDTSWLCETIESITRLHLEDLYTIKLQVRQAVEYLKSKVIELQCWAEMFVASKPKPNAIIKAGNSSGKAIMCVSKLLDVEEHVWSPMYGLKGNIDATVQVTMHEGGKDQTLTVPLEVKTGKNANAAHRAQTALYNLLLSDRYDVDIACGILYYMETSETIRIPAVRHEIRHMIMQRNELACFVRERHAQLPPMLKNPNICKGCYAKVPCFIYHRLADNGTGETSGLKEKFDQLVKHLTPKHKEFFLKWDSLLTKEEKESLKFRRELWTMLSTEREKLGRCFSNVVIEPGSAFEEKTSSKINRFRYTMIKQDPQPLFSFTESQITVGEPIVISDEEGHFALANGFVTHVRKHRITVAVDRRLHNARIRRPGFDETDNQVFASIMEVVGEGETAEPTSTKTVEQPTLYRLDKDEFSNGMATVRNNLIQTMAEGTFGSREIRSLVVDLAKPRFKPHSTAYVLKDRANINVDQRRAIEKVMSAQDYALVLGMPGTGKTTTIAHIIRALVGQGKSVLLTSYTHSAVDNILLKLRDDGIPILRLGAPAKIHADVQDFTILAAKAAESFEDIRKAWHDSPVVATTCLGINHPIFSERTFDYCIVDEASQITLPVCIGPIRMARTFILVGDHNQLPPLVQNQEARTGGLDVSLFKHLSDMHPSSVVNLEHQYRMCEDVMTLSNNLIYSGRLKCGTPEVAARSMHIPNIDGLRQHHFTPSTTTRAQRTICCAPVPGRCWIRDLVDPSAKVRFINTDTLLPQSREESKGNRIVNHTEVSIVTQLVEALVCVGVSESSIGVMTHYRSQLALLKDSLRGRGGVEMHTADRFQGRDKEVVILSLVRSNEAKSIGELLKDWRRINVAFTRAKTKLLVVGSRETLKGNSSEEMVAKFVDLMEVKQWIYALPKDALEMHLFEEDATQVSASFSSKPSATQWKPIDVLGRKRSNNDDKENINRTPRKAKIGNKALMAGKPVLRDIMNDLAGANC